MFRRARRTSEHLAETKASVEPGISFAWKTHSAITDWTAKVDYKAAIVLSLGGVVLGFFVTLSGHGRVLANLHGAALIVEQIGLSACIIGVLLAGLVVAPRLNRRQTRTSWRENVVYFGHLRYWDPKDLAERLQSLDAGQQLVIMATQLVTTSKIAWRKHSTLQWSMALLLLGVVLVALSVALLK